ncbi:fimbrial chaperone [Escherichia coli]|uniref:fimbrial chaperone n=1 Tax=Escherichia coli TaxID=562 RepID=UPI00050B3EA7|nr:fimbrial chaperone [Escherichia coli]EFE0993395.1 fimbrial chaperone [Escherichia coli O159:H19]EFP8750634.1 fimbrial chaperone [Shigella flexneri]EKH5995263.1 fimbrial chaperone [Escherichia coli O8]ELP2953615.1 fimbrial chaperone [Escherichia coli O168]ELW2702907.1 fimbrial chaperone [Escherichia coli O26]MCF0257796.1 fimbrial chaperone [Bacteroides heparinolyticus]
MILFFFSTYSYAAFVLNGTRFIYDEDKKNSSFTVTNKSDKTYGGQVWIDNSTQGNGVYMVPQPPFFRVGANQNQIIRILNTDTSLPKDRESLFWLNVQEVPPKPETNGEGSVLSIAMNTRVKLIYRPSSIKEERKGAEKKLKIVHKGDETWLKNPTPYYMALINVKDKGKSLGLSDSVMTELAKFAPFSEIKLAKNIFEGVSVEAINDWGGVEQFEISR